MTGPESSSLDHQVAAWLISHDQALLAGRAGEYPSPYPPDSEGRRALEERPELRSRLEGDLECLRLLRWFWPSPPQKDAPDSAEGGSLQLGRFHVRRELGRGAFGVVFLAYDPKLGRDVALKVPRPEMRMTGEARERFLREARAAAGLDHPNVVPVFEVQIDGPICTIASAYCPGVNLADWLKEHPQPVPAREAAALLIPLAEAVEHAHSRGVIHRDLKPANILLQRNHETREIHEKKKKETPGPPATLSGEVASSASSFSCISCVSWFTPKITDFGLAKLMDEEAMGYPNQLTQSGAMLGTPSYMAPEQARGHGDQVGPAADVYALGAILYELLAGRPPHRGETKLDTLELVRTQEPVPLRQLAPRLPRDLETICMQCLENDPARRYPSAAALAEDLRRFRAGTPVRARPPWFWERWVKSARRRPAVVALTAVSAAAVVALVTVVGAYNAHLQDKYKQLYEALQAAKASQREADQNLDLACSLVYQFATRQTEEPRLRLHNLEFYRKDVLLAALASLDELARRRPDDPGIQAARGAVYLQLGRVKTELYEIQEALPFLEKAEAILRQLADRHPQTRAHQADLARLCVNLGRTHHRLGRSDVGEPYYLEATRLAESLARLEPANEEYQKLLGQGHNGLTALHLDLDRLDLAEPAARKAGAFADALVRDHPQVPSYRALLAESLNNLGALSCRTGRLQEARAALGRARELGEVLTREHPTEEHYRCRLARSLTYLGGCHWAGGERQAAEAAYARARDLFAQVANRHPDSLDPVNDLAIVLHNLAALSTATRLPDRAKEANDWACPILTGKARCYQRVPEHMVQLAVHGIARVVRLDGSEFKPPRLADIKAPIEMLQNSVQDRPFRWTYRASHARALNNRGLIHLHAGRWKKAGEDFEDARNRLTEALAAQPSVIDHVLDLSAIYHNLGQLALSQTNAPKALKLHSQAVGLLENKLQNLPRRAEAWRHLVVAYAARARVLADLGRFEEMRRDLARLRELDPKPEGDPLRLYRACMLAPPQPAATASLAADLRDIPDGRGGIYLLDLMAFQQPLTLL